MAERPGFSEREFHRWLAGHLSAGRTGPLPIGDDTAALPLGGGRLALLTTDALVEGTHFLAGSPPRSVGRAAAEVSLSDLAAKGGRPVAFLLDLLIPPWTPARWAREVALGAEAALARHGAHLVGGDTKASDRPAVVGTLFGVGRSAALAPRSGARPGDLLVVTGRVGEGGLAAERLERFGPTPAVLQGLLDVRARVREGPSVARAAHAVVDTSDGLAEGARLLAEASRAKVVVDWERLPLAPGLLRTAAPRPALVGRAFFGGDYELLAALPARRLGGLRRALARTGCPLTVVGAVERGRGAVLRTARGVRPMPAPGWDPFRWASGRWAGRRPRRARRVRRAGVSHSGR